MPTRSPKRILLMRHGATVATRQHRFDGSTDKPLTAEGARQVRPLASAVAEFDPQAVLCSPLKRCRQTASFLLPSPAPPITFASDLREMDFGKWEGKRLDEINLAAPAQLKRLMRLDPSLTPEGGESVGAFLERVQSIAEAIGSARAERLLVITHGGVLRALLCTFLHLPIRRCFYSFDIAPAARVEIELFTTGAVMRSLHPAPPKTSL